MGDSELSQAEIADMFGGEAGPVVIDADEIEVSLALRTICDQLLEAAEKAGVDVNEIARRLRVSPSTANRLLGGENDMRLSATVLYARSLGCKWDFVLTPDVTTRAAVEPADAHAAATPFIGPTAARAPSPKKPDRVPVAHDN